MFVEAAVQLVWQSLGDWVVGCVEVAETDSRTRGLAAGRPWSLERGLHLQLQRQQQRRWMGRSEE